MSHLCQNHSVYKKGRYMLERPLFSPAYKFFSRRVKLTMKYKKPKIFAQDENRTSFYAWKHVAMEKTLDTWHLTIPWLFALGRKFLKKKGMEAPNTQTKAPAEKRLMDKKPKKGLCRVTTHYVFIDSLRGHLATRTPRERPTKIH